MEEAISKFLDSGILGAIVVVLGFAYYKKDQALKELNDKRINDRDLMAERVFKIAEALTELFEKNGGK